MADKPDESDVTKFNKSKLKKTDETAVKKKLRPREGAGAKLVVLLLNDEYGTSKGGISTINRKMACRLATNGAEVHCTVLYATQKDKDDAARDGVKLIFPKIYEGDTRPPELSWLTWDHASRYPDLPDVDFIVGHVHITSRAARQIKERFPNAKLVLVTHVIPEDTGHYKGDEKVMSMGEDMKAILEDLQQADVIISVGPLMYDYYESQIRSLLENIPHYEYLPDPSDIFWNTQVAYIETATKVVLSVGRVAGVERLKGYDIAAKAMGKVIDLLPNTRWRVRGITAEDFPESKEIIQANVEKGTFKFTPLKYSTQEDLSRDMQQAHVVLMPSRAEPFGLVGLEAIAAGVPVLVSHKSGLAWFLGKNHVFDRPIVELEDDNEEAVKTLAKRIINILQNGRKEFEAAQKLKEDLLASNYWEESHEKFLATFGL